MDRPHSDDEAREALREIADALDRLTFTRGWVGCWTGAAALKVIREYARIVANDVPDAPLRKRAAFREQVRGYCHEIRRNRAATHREFP